MIRRFFNSDGVDVVRYGAVIKWRPPRLNDALPDDIREDRVQIDGVADISV